MQREVLLPQVELTMESALIAKWLVRIGDHVSAQQPILEVETQKATSEVPSPAAGYVRQLCVEEGQTVEEKALLCILTDTADEPIQFAESPRLRLRRPVHRRRFRPQRLLPLTMPAASRRLRLPGELRGS